MISTPLLIKENDLFSIGHYKRKNWNQKFGQDLKANVALKGYNKATFVFYQTARI